MRILARVPYRQVADLDGCLRFHTEGLGFEVVERLDDEHGVFWAALRHGPARLMLSNRPVHDRVELTWLYVEDADAAWTELVEAGIRPRTRPADQEHGTREFLVEDPDGRALVIAHRLRGGG